MDPDSEVQKFKWLLVGFIAFVISGYYSFGELNYLVRGRTAEATIGRSYIAKVSSRRRMREYLFVEYSFTDAAGTTVRGKERLSPDSERPTPGEKVEVQYLLGSEDSARYYGDRNWVAVLIFLACLTYVTVVVVRLWRQGTEHRRQPATPRQRAYRF